MIYIKCLSSKQIILLYLKELLNHNLDICYHILKLKRNIEQTENNNYYQNRYEKIAKEHYFLHKNHMGKFSIVHDSRNYIIKTDFKLDYYNYTGISYQIIELIHELIKLKNEVYLTKDQGYKYWLDYDDNLYSILANKISYSMNNILTVIT